MNRNEFTEDLQRWLGGLTKEEWKGCERTERLRARFVADFPPDRIAELTIDEYVSGKGKKTFCYRIEFELLTLGDMRGSTAMKFGVYFGKKKGEVGKTYRAKKRWIGDPIAGFEEIKPSILDLLAAADRDDEVAIQRVDLSPMFKGKLLAIYHPERYAPIYSDAHLCHFTSELNLPGDLGDGPRMQRALMRYRNDLSEAVDVPPVLFMQFLYQGPLRPVGVAAERAPHSNELPHLTVAVSGTQELSVLPSGPLAGVRGGEGRGKPNYEELARQSKRIGDRGEYIVLEWERNRLLKAGRSDLASQIRHIALEDDRAGYDIQSFDVDGSERQIEVKSTSAGDMERGFLLTANEFRRAAESGNYYLYLVFDALTKRPKLLSIPHPSFGSKELLMEPAVYRVRPQSDGRC